MKIRSIWTGILALALLMSSQLQAREYAYFGLEPDIVTNYVGTSARNLGYVRVTVELMLESPSHLEAAEHHAPLLRSTTIDIFGRQPEDKVKSLTGREEIRQMVADELKKLMKAETGSEMIRDVIFTQYIHQGGDR